MGLSHYKPQSVLGPWVLPGDGGLKRRGYELESGRVGKCTDQTPWACLRLKVMNLVMGDGGVVSPATSSYVPGEGSRPRADLDQGCLLLGKPKVGSCGVCPRLLVTTTKCQLERKGDDDEPRLDLTTPKLCDLRKKSLNLSFLFHKMGTQGPISTRLWSLKDDLGGQMFWPIRGPGHSGCERCLTRGHVHKCGPSIPGQHLPSVKLSQAPVVTSLPPARLLLQSHGQTPTLPSGPP